jgi:hypothetical protein
MNLRVYGKKFPQIPMDFFRPPRLWFRLKHDCKGPAQDHFEEEKTPSGEIYAGQMERLC